MEAIAESISVIILAAGLGTRMKSDKAKVLHELMDRPMILYVIETACEVVGNNITVVVGHQAGKVKEIVSTTAEVTYAYQDEQLGTGHAVKCALPYVSDETKGVIILYGDVPLLNAGTLRRLWQDHRQADRDITVLGVEMDNPTGYGRILQDDMGRVSGIVEEADATPEQRKIRSINTGIYCIKKDCLIETLNHVTADNAQEEYYLTDIFKIGHRLGKNMGVVFSPDAEEVMGINTIAELASAESLMRQRVSKTS